MSGESPKQQSAVAEGENASAPTKSTKRSESFSSQKSNDSQTAADFIRDQMQLEADAREALPYSIDRCTKPLGPLRQSVFACLTCNPAPKDPADDFTPAGVCYSCSIQCHGEHTLVEIFTKRNFTCDCGTTRLPKTSPCTLRINPETNAAGDVHSEEPDANNKYNQNFRNRFCGCECDYDPFQQKGTMFQCLGLGTAETGGCGEDWYHPGCLVGMGPEWFDSMNKEKVSNGAPKKEEGQENSSALPTISEDAENQPSENVIPIVASGPNENQQEQEGGDDEEDPPMPPGFPDEDDFDSFLCHKCVESNPWIKKYAGTKGFLLPVWTTQKQSEPEKVQSANEPSNKRKAEDDAEESDSKRVKTDPESQDTKNATKTSDETTTKTAEGKATTDDCKWGGLPSPPQEPFSLFMKEDFRDHLCRCSDCFVSKLNAHPQLLEEEETYEPPLSDGAGSEHGGSTNGSGSLLERGESALRNVDRVRAIEGVMAYNHLKDKLKPFFQQFADSGQAIGAEDIKSYFAKLRGDEQGMKEAGEAVGAGKSGEGSGPGSDGADHRREQDGC